MSALAHRRIVITRARHQSDEFEQLLLAHSAVPLLYPCIEIAPATDTISLRIAIQAALNGDFEWLVLTSANTVLALDQQLKEMGIAPERLRCLQLAAVGTATAKSALEYLKLSASLIPDNFTTEALAASMQAMQGKRVFLPQSALAEPDLETGLSQIGAVVTAIEAYRTVVGRGGVNLPELLLSGVVDAITFTSASTVDNLLNRFEAEGGDRTLLTRFCLACIGLKTASRVRSHNLPVTVMSTEHTLTGLVSALESYYAKVVIGESD